MNISELHYDYPLEAIALMRKKNSRILYSSENSDPQEISKSKLLSLIQPGDLFVFNETYVEPRKVSAYVQRKNDNLDVLFVKALSATRWQVLLPLRQLKVNDILELPQRVKAQVEVGGLPQTFVLNKVLPKNYFETWGKVALPPYIEKARMCKAQVQNFSTKDDKKNYQTQWAKYSGSSAAPTASFHFELEDLELLKKKGVQVLPLTLHIGLGTFLPVQEDNLSNHIMHKEEVFIPSTTVQALSNKTSCQKVWALGTTVTRALESLPLNYFSKNKKKEVQGVTDLMIFPGFKFQNVDVLLTNFHQPCSTLLALVMAFAGCNRVEDHYRWAIQRNFQLFSYGDLSVWKKAQ